jgi:hypothetical protein
MTTLHETAQLERKKGRITVPQVLARFAAYHASNGGWGSLHIVLDDANVEDSCVTFCKKTAIAQGDSEGAELADLLMLMSKTQRLKLHRIA